MVGVDQPVLKSALHNGEGFDDIVEGVAGELLAQDVLGLGQPFAQGVEGDVALAQRDADADMVHLLAGVLRAAVGVERDDAAEDHLAYVLHAGLAQNVDLVVGRVGQTGLHDAAVEEFDLLGVLRGLQLGELVGGGGGFGDVDLAVGVSLLPLLHKVADDVGLAVEFGPHDLPDHADVGDVGGEGVAGAEQFVALLVVNDVGEVALGVGRGVAGREFAALLLTGGLHHGGAFGDACLNVFGLAVVERRLELLVLSVEVLLRGDVAGGFAHHAHHFQFAHVGEEDAVALELAQGDDAAADQARPEHAEENLRHLVEVLSPRLLGVELRHVLADGRGDLVGHRGHGFLDKLLAGLVGDVGPVARGNACGQRSAGVGHALHQRVEGRRLAQEGVGLESLDDGLRRTDGHAQGPSKIGIHVGIFIQHPKVVAVGERVGHGGEAHHWDRGHRGVGGALAESVGTLDDHASQAVEFSLERIDGPLG